MEIVSNLPFPDRMYIPWERLLRACLIILMSAMLYLGVYNHVEGMEEEPRRDIVDAAVIKSGTGLLKTDPMNIGKDAGKIMGILPGRDIGRFEALPAPHINNGANEIRTAGKTEVPEVPKSGKTEALAPIIEEKEMAAEESVSDKAEALAPIVGEKETAAEESVSDKTEAAPPIVGEKEIAAEESVSDKTEAAPPIVGEKEIAAEESVSDKTETVPPIIEGSEITPESSIPNKPETADPIIEETEITEITVSDSVDNGTDVKVPETPAIDESDMEADDPDCSGEGTTILAGFVLDAEGYITGTESGVDVTDGILVFPIDPGCVGIREGALSSLGEYVYELYIPANIRGIDRGVFAELTSLMYIEVEEGNPCFYSMDGILYSVTGEVVYDPCEAI